jgi:hypothetical protein
MIIKPLQLYVVTCEITPFDYYHRHCRVKLKINDILIVLKEEIDTGNNSSVLLFIKVK